MSREEMREVWVVEKGEYSDRYVWGIYSSPESAVEHIKAMFGEPYIVTWEMDGLSLIGHFEEVNHYSIKHTAVFDIESWEVDSDQR